MAISYKTMPNLQKIISNHNRKILHPNKPRNKRPVDTTARATVFGRRKVNMQHYLCTFGNLKKKFDVRLTNVYGANVSKKVDNSYK